MTTPKRALTLAGLTLVTGVGLIGYYDVYAQCVETFSRSLGASASNAQGWAVAVLTFSIMLGCALVLATIYHLVEWKVEADMQRNRRVSYAPGAPKSIANLIVTTRDSVGYDPQQHQQVVKLCNDTAAYFAGVHSEAELTEFCELLDLVKTQIVERRVLMDEQPYKDDAIDFERRREEYDAGITAYAEYIARKLKRRNATQAVVPNEAAQRLIDKNEDDKSLWHESDD